MSRTLDSIGAVIVKKTKNTSGIVFALAKRKKGQGYAILALDHGDLNNVVDFLLAGSGNHWGGYDGQENMYWFRTSGELLETIKDQRTMLLDRPYLRLLDRIEKELR